MLADLRQEMLEHFDEIYRRFEREPDTLAIAVVDESGAPVGIVERNAFTLKMAAGYGRALFAGRPVSAVMDAQPLLVEAETTLASFLAGAVQMSPSALLRGLDVEERPILEMSLQGYTTQEISARLGRPERSVRRLRERVKKQLQRLQLADA